MVNEGHFTTTKNSGVPGVPTVQIVRLSKIGTPEFFNTIMIIHLSF